MNPILEKAKAAGASAEEIKTIEASCVRCVHLHPAGVASGGRSYFGGVPLVPDGFRWPFSSEEKRKQKVRYSEEQYLAGPLTFIAQIDLEEVSSLAGRVLPLPAEGLLLFFATPQKVDHPHTGSVGPDWLVEYLPNRCPLAPAIPPILPAEFSEKVIGESRFVLPRRGLRMSVGWSVNATLRYKLPHLSSTMESPHPHHILGGFPDTLQSPIEGCGDYLPPEGVEKLSPGDRVAAIRNDKDWVQLLQIDSDDGFDFSWLYGGRGHIMIRPQHLAALSFDKVVLVTQVA